MPQLDKFSFMPQIFWLIIIFFSLYIIILNLILPQLFCIIKIRTKLVSNLKYDLLNFGNKALLLQKIYIDNVNFLVLNSTYCLFYLRILLNSHINLINNYIKNVIHLY